jgi:hypothetical protein
MNPELQAQINEYLTNNLTLNYQIQPDVFQINPDQITIQLVLEGNVINQIVMYNLNDY